MIYTDARLLRGYGLMGRLKELRKYVDNELDQMEDVDKRTGAIVHLYGV